MKDKVLMGLGVVVLVLGAFMFFGSDKTQQGPQGPAGRDGQSVGAVSTLDSVSSPFVKIGAKEMWFGAFGVNSATSSIICALKNPYGATTTMNRITARIDSNGMGAQVLYISTSTSAFATSTAGVPTLVAGKAVAASGKAEMSWYPGQATTTQGGVVGPLNSNGESPFRLLPSEFILVNVATATAGTFTAYMTGQCTAALDKF